MNIERVKKEFESRLNTLFPRHQVVVEEQPAKLNNTVAFYEIHVKIWTIEDKHAWRTIYVRKDHFDAHYHKYISGYIRDVVQELLNDVK